MSFIYLIQDFEPGFHPWWTKYALAASTVPHAAFRAIVNEPTLLEYLHRHGDLAFDAHDPDQAVVLHAGGRSRRVPASGPPVGSTAVRRVVCATEASAEPRSTSAFVRCPMPSSNARSMASSREFAAIGGETRSLPLPGGRGLRPTPRLAYRDYATFLADSDVLLSLMLSPHTSLSTPRDGDRAEDFVITNTFSTKPAAALMAISTAVRGSARPRSATCRRRSPRPRPTSPLAGRKPTGTTLPKILGRVVEGRRALGSRQTIASARGRSSS